MVSIKFSDSTFLTNVVRILPPHSSYCEEICCFANLCPVSQIKNINLMRDQNNLSSLPSGLVIPVKMIRFN